MTTTDTHAQEAAAVARLAELPCLSCGGTGQDEPLDLATEVGGLRGCHRCQATGDRFPELLEKCHACLGSGIVPHRHGESVCRFCPGNGWRATSPAKALHWLLGRQEYRCIEYHPGEEYRAFWVSHGDVWQGEGPTPLLALVAAIEKVSRE